MKKFLSAAVPLLILSIAASFFYYAAKNGAEKIIEKELAKMPEAAVNFGSLKVGFLAGFPNLSVALGDVTVTSRESPANEPLLKAELLYFSVNAASLLWGKEYEITEAGLQNARLAFVKEPDGRFNWDIFKKSGAPKSSPEEALERQTAPRVTNEKPIGILLKKLSFRNVELSYSDSGFYADIKSLNGDAFGTSSSGRLTAGISLASGDMSYGKTGGDAVSGVKISSALKAVSEGGKVFNIEKGLLKLNDITAEISGKIAVVPKGADVDITADINGAPINGITALLPSSFIEPIKDMKADGTISVKAAAEGLWSGGSVPNARAEINIDNVSFEEPEFMKNIKNTKAFLSLSLPGGTGAKGNLEINSLKLYADEGAIEAKGTIKNIFKAPELNVKVSGEAPAELIGSFYRYEYVKPISGSVIINSSAEGPASGKAKESGGTLKLTGTTELENVTAQVPGYSDVTVSKALIEFYPEYALIRGAAIKSGNGSALIDAKITGYSKYILEGKPPRVEAAISSDFIDLNELIKKNPQGEEPTNDSGNSRTGGHGSASENARAEGEPQNPKEEAAEHSADTRPEEPKIPDAAAPGRRILADADLDIKIKKLIFKNAVLTNLTCTVAIKNGEAEILDLSFDAMGGSIDLSGLYSFDTAGKKASGNMKVKAENLRFKEVFAHFKTVRELAPVFNSVDGYFSLNGNFGSKPGTDSPFSAESVEGNGTIIIKEAKISGIKTLEKIGMLLKIGDPGRLSLKNVDVAFVIKDGELTAAPFDVKIGDAVARFQGTTTLKRTVDYYGEITVPSPWGDKKNPLSADFRITGSYDSPELIINTSETLDRAADSLLNSIFR